MNYAEFLIIFFSKTVDEPKIRNILNYKLDNTNDPFKKALKFLKITLVLRNIKSKSFDANFTVTDTSSSKVI